MALHSISDILDQAKASNQRFWEIVLEDDFTERMVTREASIKKMSDMWEAMLSASENYDGSIRSISGLVGQDGERMNEYSKKGNTISGDFMSEVIAEALSMGESNACMKRIVAAPTAGSCGVLPAVLIPMNRRYNFDRDRIIEALYVTGGIGLVTAYRASVSGAAGGCQAEIGTASSMAAGALVYLMGGTDDQIVNALAMALKNLLGLICDPVAGYVEVPCVKRNVLGAVNAVAAADMALAGIKSVIPPDEVIDAMGAVGREMPTKFRETACGGLAATPTAIQISNRLKKSAYFDKE